MKKVLAVAALSVFGLASCKKDYTCKCTFTNGSSLNIEYQKVKKGDAEDGCASAQTTYQAADAGAKCAIQ
jgi:hypothetical protein